jgi:citrate lyase subunit beta/citryl-CoA lyase
MSAALDFAAPLFVPGNRPERFAKAAGSAADAIILDLEDAVSPDAKDYARSCLSADFTDKPIIVRINAVGTPWHEADLASVAALPFSAIMLPKVAFPDNLTKIADVRPVVALVETARGLADARLLARSGQIARFAFGSVDFAADLGCAHNREALAAARAELLLASRLGGLVPPLDGVSLTLHEPTAILADARFARMLGFGGKLCIHPSQVRPVLEGFMPDEAECAWARRVLASGEGAVAIDGAMIDAPVRARANAILARANV